MLASDTHDKKLNVQKIEDIQKVLSMSIQSLKGIGQARAVLLNKIGIFDIQDAIFYFPREYEDRSKLKSIGELQHEESCSFEGRIASKVTERRIHQGMTIQKLLIQDSTGTLEAVWFNQGYLKDVFKIGESYVFYGKIAKNYKSTEVQNPVYERVGDQPLKSTCRIMPMYASTAKLTQSIIRNVIQSAIERVFGKLLDILPPSLKSKHQLCDINAAIQNIHFPTSEDAFQYARYRLVFEELLMLQLGLFNIKNATENQGKGIVFGSTPEVGALMGQLPFELTQAQKRVFDEVSSDMESAKTMNRLIQGDVGSGKTIVAVLAIYKAVKSGYQAAMMVPTAILAEQHFTSFKQLLEGTGVRIALLTSGGTKKQKETVMKDLQEGHIDILIGTHALLEERVVYQRLGLVVTDEQHRFGVRQRAVLSQKGNNPDILVMTATPIPRTLALILYGDLDISIIDELPPGRKPIETYIAQEGLRERLHQFIRKKVLEGRQIYIVCPLIEESEEMNAKSAIALAEKITQKDFPDLKVGLIHGKQKPKEKETVMQDFVHQNIDILVSTTVIEVGVNVPNATVMMIENAERFGLAQLHQLRGRVGRGEHQSYCILLNESRSEVARERMQIMQKTQDGFVISEKDFELRGSGDFFGTRQHGIPELKIANLYRDMEILKCAQKEVLEIMQRDRRLEEPEHQDMRACLETFFTEHMKTLSMN